MGPPTETQDVSLPQYSGPQHLQSQAQTNNEMTANDQEAPRGLTSEQARARFDQDGPNEPETERAYSLLAKLSSYFIGPIPFMVEAAALLSAIAQDWEDFIIILIMLFVNAGVGFWQEYSADQTVAALRSQLALTSRVRRDGIWMTAPARQLVKGDVVYLKLGDIVPADIQITGSGFLRLDQSNLTGESLPVDCSAGQLAPASSAVVLGTAYGTVTATGKHTQFGKTVTLVDQAQKRSRFQDAVLGIGNALAVMAVILAGITFLVEVFRGEDIWELVVFLLTLLVAAIPVALPAVLSVTLAVGAGKMAKAGVIVSRLVAIEELAGVEILLSDKTGTLTQNNIAIQSLLVRPGRDLSGKDLLTAAAWTCDPLTQDPIDSAVMRSLEGHGFQLDTNSNVKLTPFDPVSKMASAVVTGSDGRVRKFAKGAVQVILNLCKSPTEEKEQVMSFTSQLAGKGMRAVAVASTDQESKWTVEGVLSLSDPLRPDTASTIRQTQDLGIRVQIVTGDHVDVARQVAITAGIPCSGFAIGPELETLVTDHDNLGGLEKLGGFAQVFPEHKFKIVKMIQKTKRVVAMTGDGVNDAPALKQADVGIAVYPATDAARAAADIVLVVQGISVIIAAMKESRKIFERMTNYTVFRIAETVRVLVFVSLSKLLIGFVPLTPATIVILALLNDIPIMTIAVDRVRPSPKPVRWDLTHVLTLATVLGLSGVFSSFLLFWYANVRLDDWTHEDTQTLMFLKLLVAGHLTLFVARAPRNGWFWSRPFPGLRLVGAVELTQVLGTLFAVYGVFMQPIGWVPALLVWVYSFAWMLINTSLKRLVESALGHQRERGAWHARLHGRVQER